MRDVYAVLREKEHAIERVRREIEALRLVSHLLADEEDFQQNVSASGAGTDGRPNVVRQDRVVHQERKAINKRATPLAGQMKSMGTRTVEASEKGTQPDNARNALLQFKKVAIDASRSFFRRVLDSSLTEYELRRKGLRNLLERFARSPAA